MEPNGVDLLAVLEFIGVAAFALSGAFAAVARRLDVAVCCVAAVAAGLAGATLRDLLIGVPVSWLDAPILLAACLVAAGLVWAAGDRAWSARALVWSDAVGLGAVAAVAVSRAAGQGVTPLAAAAIGVLAAAAGGLVRDGITRQPPLMLGRELYIAAAAAGVLLFVVLRLVQIDAALSAGAAALLTFALRAGALRRGWSLPGPAARED